MDDSRFDAWTRRTFGFTAGGFATSLLGLAAGDDAEAKNGKGKRRRKRHKKRPHVCAGRNNCQAVATCHHPAAEVQCFCFVTANSGKPYCSIGSVGVSDCDECASGQTCVDLTGDRCGNLVLACADPCPKPL